MKDFKILVIYFVTFRWLIKYQVFENFWKPSNYDKVHYLLMLGQLREILKKISVYRCGLSRAV